MSHLESDLRLRLLQLLIPEDSASPRPPRPPPGAGRADSLWGGVKAVLWALAAVFVGLGLAQLR